MMNKKRTHTAGRIKYALFVPLAAALLIASNISCISSEKQEEISEKQESRTAEGEVFQVVEEMPEFPGGMAECMKWLAQNIKYPAEAQEKGVQGRVIVQMVVEKDGTITHAKVVRGVDPLLDTEALRVVNSSPKWKPGKQNGEAVRVKYTLPIMFRLGGDSSDSKAAEAPKEAKVDENGVHQICEEMPEFPGGMQECMKWLGKNINYPEDCKKAGIQGRVIIQFVVDKDGSIKSPKVARSVHPSLDAEALRVISSSPKWKPGKQKGEAVKVRYTIPVLFKLQ
jgi:TonB family protein